MIRFGIVGFGLHAVKRLMPGFSRAKNCKVIALSRRSMQDARQSAAEHQIPLAFASAADLSHSPEVDAVLVTTPNSCHLADVLTALDAGKPVLCEKPLGMNSHECQQMVEAARKKGVLFGVAQIFRFTESAQKFRELIAGGNIGKPVFARSEFSFLADPSHPRKWIYDARVAGAGPIFDVGVHCIDTLRFILQDEVMRVSAAATSDQRSGEVESAGTLALEFSKGTLGTVLVSFRAEYRTPLEVVGGSGVLRADDALNVEHPIEIALRRGSRTVESYPVSSHLAYALQVDAFAGAVEGKSKFLAPAEEGWQNQEILDAALRSIRSGKAEDVPRVVT
jgi:predicted dehydrogenase